jgi:hypothetical protein
MMRRLVVLPILLCAALAAGPWMAVGSAAAHPAARPAALGPTVVTHVSPVSSHGDLLSGYSITKRHNHAKCSAGSDTTHNTYRCFAGNGVYDPCWVQSTKSLVVCLDAPWSFRLVQLKVKHYSNSGRTTTSSKTPWGLQLANGVQCGLATGATTLIAGKRLSYFCAHVKYVLYGGVDRSGRVWTIRKATPKGHHGHYRKAGRVRLTKAWFAKASRKG